VGGLVRKVKNRAGAVRGAIGQNLVSKASLAVSEGGRAERLGLTSSSGGSQLVGGHVAIFIEGHIHGKSVLLRLAVPKAFGVLSQPGNP
jgi:hypothetical protein